MSKTDVLVGIVGAGAKPEARELPDGAPPSWGASS